MNYSICVLSPHEYQQANPLSPKVENQQSVDAEVTDPVKAPFAEL